ncbi:aldehyde dehydrogenase family protein [Rhodococcus sp. NPDC019627]|jgi:acyl-CoA reductase-like NAD-dependent aldehyde dehydrogenase|uniref:aldehyde dehydrogenase family protein n=1 Tax=Rhodococcus TaxID=1827 RepID=UPI002955A343|nr:aldehyde dehydrogenase family protein [Rhodococcus oxybenzonivorans]MDV7353347.1 aldehyde dehydrogenase family protein [Rhodococcus oxybenzonivorans]
MTIHDDSIDYLQLIDGELRPSRNGQWIDSVNPATSQVWARIPAGGAGDVDDAVRAAKSALDSWRALPAAARAALLRSWAATVRDNLDTLWRLDATDNGRARREAEPAIAGAASQIEFHAGLAETITGDTVLVSDSATTYSVREPFGVVGLIIPWNAPLAMFLAKVSAAIAAGNTIVVKPPERASVSVLVAAQLLEKAGIPRGVVNVVTGEGSSAGEALVRHPDVRKISFTGSTATGRRITENSVANIKSLALELGGKSPNIVFADADLEHAADVVAAGIYTASAGQACIAGSRILVEEAIFDDFVERLRSRASAMVLGNPLDSQTDMGPLAFDGQYDKVREYLQIGRQEGATLAFGGRCGNELFPPESPLRDGYFVEPTLFLTEDPQLRVCQEEIFGPVAVAMPFADEADALRLANDSGYGLAAGVWTQNLSRALRFTRRLEAGTVWVNTYRRLHWALPFGGQKESGTGTSNGPTTLDEWLEHKSVWIEHG